FASPRNPQAAQRPPLMGWSARSPRTLTRKKHSANAPPICNRRGKKPPAPRARHATGTAIETGTGTGTVQQVRDTAATGHGNSSSAPRRNHKYYAIGFGGVPSPKGSPPKRSLS